jgi:hypothetical protein
MVRSELRCIVFESAKAYEDGLSTDDSDVYIDERGNLMITSGQGRDLGRPPISDNELTRFGI